MTQTENYCLKCGTTCVGCNGGRCRCGLNPSQVFVSNKDIRTKQKDDNMLPIHKRYIKSKTLSSDHMTVQQKQNDTQRWMRQMNATK